MKKFIWLLLLLIFLNGCGPDLHSSQKQYILSINAATATLNILATLKQANKLTPEEIAKIDVLVNQFERYRIQVRAAIDANEPSIEPNKLLGSVIDQLIEIQLAKEGAK